jgi:hypothetical protein
MSNFIDGDFVETFMDLSSEDQLNIISQMQVSVTLEQVKDIMGEIARVL